MIEVKNNIFLLLFAALCQFTFAQELPQVNDVFNSVYIKNVNIVLSSNDIIKNGSILIKNKTIEELGKDVSPLINSFIIDGKESYVYPGFINTTILSNVKFYESKDTIKYTPGNPPDKIAGINPKLRAADFISQKKKDFKSFNEIGFTEELAILDNGMISGFADLVTISPDGNSNAFKNKSGLILQFQTAQRVYPSTLMGIIAKLKQLFFDAQRYKKWKENYNKPGSNLPRPSEDETSEILLKVLDHEIPVLFKVDSENDILRVLKLKEEFDFNLIILSGREAWKVSKELKEKNVPVILSLNLPPNPNDSSFKKFELPKEYFKSEKSKNEIEEKKRRQKIAHDEYWLNASKLKAAGVRFALGSFDLKPDKIKNTLLELKKYNLTEDDILNSFTKNFANIFDLNGKTGSLTKGSAANFFLTDKPYFEKNSAVKSVFIDGIRYEIENSNKSVKEKK